MKALQLSPGETTPRLVDVSQPEPGPGQVLMRVGGAGACHSDLHLMEGLAALMGQDAFTLGHENAGWIEALGPGVAGFEVGQPVAVYGPWGCGVCRTCRQGNENYCETGSLTKGGGGGLGIDGGMAEYLLVPSPRLLVPLDKLAPWQAAPLTDAALTPYHAVKRSLPRLVPGSAAVVIGAGGLGHMAVQILKALTPAKVIVVDARAEALELATSLGADKTVLTSDKTVEEVRGLTNGRGAELVLDLVGSSDTLPVAAGSGCLLGDVTLVGLGMGTVPFGFMTQPYECSLTATYWGGIIELMEVIALAEAGMLEAHIERFPLDQAVEAYDRMREGRLQGRAVIVP